MKKQSYVLLSIAMTMGVVLVAEIAAQETVDLGDLGSISGDLQLDAQYYVSDSTTGAEEVPEDIRMNGYLNLIYTRGAFSAGLRYESYEKPLLGYDPRFEGTGITYRFASYTTDILEATIGDFYEQFGNGMILRSYEDRQLGFDNAIDGFRLKVRPIEGLTLTGLLGRQRSFFDKGPGIVRGADADLNLNRLFSGLQESSLSLQIGGSVVSKFQEDEDPVYNLPENVFAYAGRINMSLGGFTLLAELAHKANDPAASDGYQFPGDSVLTRPDPENPEQAQIKPRTNPANLSYNDGSGLFLNLGYSEKGLGINLSAKRVQKMDFRSDRAATGNNLNLNFLPPQSKTHSYRLVTLFPYATQPNGEIGAQGEIIFKVPRKSGLGGKYGIDVAINYSRLHVMEPEPLDTFLYDVSFLGDGKRIYDDFNFEINKKWSKDFKTNFAYYHIAYNKDIIEGKSGYGLVYSDIGVVELTYKFSETHSLRTEVQHAWSRLGDNATAVDDGNWAFLLAEYAIAPNWFVTLSDEYNYGNDDEDRRLHYYGIGAVYVHDANRFSLQYARQREGIVCVGGVCRNVPASTGLQLSVSSSF